MLYKDWLNVWLENFVKTSSKQTTYLRYKQLIDKHIISNLGGYRLNELSIMILQKYINKLLIKGNLTTKQGLSANTINLVISIIKNSLKTAKSLNYINENSANNIIKPKNIEKQVDCFSIFEQKKIEEYIFSKNKRKLLGIIIALYTGIRIGELLALKFSDIDFEKGLMKIDKNCYDYKSQRVITTTKTYNSTRVIPLPKKLLKIIKKLKNQSRCDFVVNEKDKPLTNRSYQRTFELLLKKLKIEHKRFHALRHTFATRAIECGVDVKTLSEILGHKNPTITLKRYTHSLLDHKQKMMENISKML